MGGDAAPCVCEAISEPPIVRRATDSKQTLVRIWSPSRSDCAISLQARNLALSSAGNGRIIASLFRPPAEYPITMRTTGGAGATVRYKKNGNVITTTTSVVSDDGKSLTVTIKIPDGKGNEITSIAVYERQ